jgi:hypothetical protein
MRRAALIGIGLLCLVVPATAASRVSTRTNVYCEEMGPKIAPKTCEFYSRPGIAGTYVTGLHWRNWGALRTAASGTFRGNMNYTHRVTIRLSRPVLCQVGNPRTRVYTYFEERFTGEGGWTGGQIVGCDGT